MTRPLNVLWSQVQSYTRIAWWATWLPGGPQERLQITFIGRVREHQSCPPSLHVGCPEASQAHFLPSGSCLGSALHLGPWVMYRSHPHVCEPHSWGISHISVSRLPTSTHAASRMQQSFNTCSDERKSRGRGSSRESTGILQPDPKRSCSSHCFPICKPKD